MGCLRSRPRRLSLHYLTKGDAAAINLCHQNSQAIQHLELSFKELTNEGIRQILSFNWSCLSYLQLTKNNIGDKGCIYISQFRGNLMILALGSNRVGNAGACHLSKGMWPNLYNINLSDNKLRYEGIYRLLKGNWKDGQLCLLGYNYKYKFEQIRVMLLLRQPRQLDQRFTFFIWQEGLLIDQLEKYKLWRMIKPKMGIQDNLP